jgi:hypothetical protein
MSIGMALMRKSVWDENVVMEVTAVVGRGGYERDPHQSNQL